MHVLSDEEATALPTVVRRMLRSQCDGDWTRVTVDDLGGFTVWNNAKQALSKCGLQPAPEPLREPERAPAAQSARPKAQPAPPPAPAPSRREKRSEAAALQEMVGHHEIKPGVTIVSAPEREPEPERHVWVGDWENFDWDSVDLDSSVVRLRDQLIHGLPQRVPFRFHADVLALQGFNLDAVEAAIRVPQRVKIRPETRAKGYPVLAFERGDVIAILGMRNPTSPMCIAAYLVSRHDPDLFHGTMGSLGGGGAKKNHGLPSSVRAMIKQLRAVGAEIDEDPRATTAEVKYQGQCLGKITTGMSSKQQVQSDYQRTLRKMNAIDQRGQKVGASA